MKITAYNERYNLDLSGATGVVASSASYGAVSLGSNTPLIESGAGSPGSGPQAAAWDHVHPEFSSGSNSSSATAYGSNSTRVASVSSAGASGSNSRADHVHDGIGTITASSSNTLNRGTVNLRAGTGIALALSNTNGGSGLDTVTINNLSSGGGGGSTLTVEEVDGSPTDSAITKIKFPNGTLSITSHEATYTPAAAAASRPYLDLAVALDGTYGWDCDTSSLPGAFTRRNISGGETFQDGGGSWLRTAISSATSAQFYYENAPSGDWEFMWAGTYFAADAQMMVGPLVIDSSGAGRAACWYTDGLAYVMVLASNAYSSTGPTIPGVGAFAHQGVRHWISLRKVSQDYSARVSLDGVNWSRYSSVSNWTGTVDKVGFGRFWTSTSNQQVIATDIFNRIA